VSYLQNNNVDEDFQKNEQIVNLIKDRANFPKDLWDLSKYFYVAPTEFETKAVKKQWKDNTGQILTDIKQVLDNLDLWTADQIQKAIKDHIEAYALKFGQVMPPLRLAQVGSLSGPDLFTILEILGKEEVNRRITYAVNSL
jgi:glutamyl-tRNA synthetase